MMLNPYRFPVAGGGDPDPGGGGDVEVTYADIEFYMPLIQRDFFGMWYDHGPLGRQSVMFGNVLRSSDRSKWTGYSANMDSAGKGWTWADEPAWNLQDDGVEATFELWVWLDAITQCCYLRKDSGDPTTGFYFGMQNSGRLIYAQGGVGVQGPDVVPGVGFPNGWNFIRLVKGDGYVRMQMNNTTTANIPIANGLPNSGPMLMGEDGSTGGTISQYWNDARFSHVATTNISVPTERFPDS